MDEERGSGSDTITEVVGWHSTGNVPGGIGWAGGHALKRFPEFFTATNHNDIYSLGVLLYELLAGSGRRWLAYGSHRCRTEKRPDRCGIG